ncbi:MAG: AAA family ATPase [Acidimicrobiales bacterium]
MTCALIAPGSIFVITGVSAAGKSAVAEGLASSLQRGVHIRGDVFRRMVVSGRAEMSPEPTEEALEQLRLRYELGVMVANHYAAAGFTVVLQDIFFGDLDWIVDSLVATALYVVVLDPDLDTVLERESTRAKTAYRDGAHSAEQLRAALHGETPHIGLWLDTSALSVDQTVDTILRRADEAQLLV